MKRNKKDFEYFTHVNGIEVKKKFLPGEWEEYEKICLMIWGGTPLDYDWATSTGLYKETKSSLKGQW